MELFLAWIIFAIVVAVAAGSRGRSGFGWFFLAAIISPLLALILLLILPNQREAEKMKRLAKLQSHPGLAGTSTTVQKESSGIFEPDGVFSGIPYRVAQDGSIEAIMQGAKVRFANMDRFVEALA